MPGKSPDRRRHLSAAVAAVAGIVGLLAATPADAGRKTVILLDASNSMNSAFGGGRRIDSARDALASTLPRYDDVLDLGLVTFGNRQRQSCRDIETLAETRAGNAANVVAASRKVQAQGVSMLAQALQRAAADAGHRRGSSSIIAIVDGAGVDSCRIDTCETARTLKREGRSLTIHVVAIAPKGPEIPLLQCIGANSGGSYVAVGDARQLRNAVELALQATASGARAAVGPGAAPAPRRKPRPPIHVAKAPDPRMKPDPADPDPEPGAAPGELGNTESVFAPTRPGQPANAAASAPVAGPAKVTATVGAEGGSTSSGTETQVVMAPRSTPLTRPAPPPARPPEPPMVETARQDVANRTTILFKRPEPAAGSVPFAPVTAGTDETASADAATAGPAPAGTVAMAAPDADSGAAPAAAKPIGPRRKPTPEVAAVQPTDTPTPVAETTPAGSGQSAGVAIVPASKALDETQAATGSAPAPSPDSGAAMTTASVPAPAPVASPPAPTTAAAPDTTAEPGAPGTLKLAALILEGTDPVQQGVMWQVFSQTADGGKGELVTRSSDPTPSLELPSGDYLVEGRFGNAARSKGVAVRPGDEAAVEVVLDVGGLQLNPAVAGVANANAEISNTIYAAGETTPVVADAVAGAVIYLTAGTYRIVSRYGDANARAEDQIRVQSGKLVKAKINHRAAPVSFRLVEDAGGKPLDDATWIITDSSGSVVKSSDQTAPTHVLAEGNYTVTVDQGGRTFTDTVSVEPGVPVIAEIVAR